MYVPILSFLKRECKNEGKIGKHTQFSKSECFSKKAVNMLTLSEV